MWLLIIIVLGYIPVIYKLKRRISALEDEIRDLKK
ncbi:MAG: hypothetical protein TIS_04052 [Tissierella sp.]|jgi:hypothetical protein